MAMEPKKKRGRPKKIVQPDSPMDYPAIKRDKERMATDNEYRVANGFPPLYKMVLTLGSEVYEGEGATPLEALRAIPKPVKITTKARLDVTYGELKKQMLYMPFMARRLFYPLAQPTLAKRIVMLMK